MPIPQQSTMPSNGMPGGGWGGAGQPGIGAPMPGGAGGWGQQQQGPAMPPFSYTGVGALGLALYVVVYVAGQFLPWLLKHRSIEVFLFMAVVGGMTYSGFDIFYAKPQLIREIQAGYEKISESNHAQHERREAAIFKRFDEMEARRVENEVRMREETGRAAERHMLMMEKFLDRIEGKKGQ